MNTEYFTLLSDRLRKHLAFSNDEIQLIFEKGKLKKFKRGQFIINEGSVIRKTNFILEGSLIAYFIDADAQEHMIQFGIEGWWISDIHSYTFGGPSKYNVQALESGSLLEISFEDMQWLYKNIPALEKYFLIITQRAFAGFQERIVNNLCLSAEERYEAFKIKYPKIELRFPQKWIASYLGMSAEFLSKIKNKRI